MLYKLFKPVVKYYYTFTIILLPQIGSVRQTTICIKLLNKTKNLQSAKTIAPGY